MFVLELQRDLAPSGERDRPHPPDPSHALPKATMVLFIVAVLLGFDERLASAHAELVTSSPASEDLVTVPPRGIDLWFSERVESDSATLSIRVLDDQGNDLLVSDVTVDPADDRHVTARMAGISPGTVTVVWSVRSIDDGHALTGTFAFRVGSGRAPGAATTEGDRPPVWAVLARWLTFLGAAFAAGGFAIGRLAVTTGGALPMRNTRRWMVIVFGCGAALLATVAEPVLQQRWPPNGAVQPSLRDSFAALPPAWWWRPLSLIPCLALAVAGMLLARRGRALSRALVLAGFVLALASLLGLSLTSHAAARQEWKGVALAINIIHQWCVALWVGGLINLTVWRLELRVQHDPAPSEEGTRLALLRFSRGALVLVVIGVGTGLANSAFVLPTLSRLWESDYGQILLAKGLLITIPLGFAVFNRRAIRRALEGWMPRVRKAVRIEAIAVITVVLGGTVLALLAPPVESSGRPTQADIPLPAFAAYADRDLLVHLLLSPGIAGDNMTGVKLTNYDRSPFTGEQPAVVRFAFSSMTLTAEPFVVDGVYNDVSDAWSVRGSQLSLNGWWNVDVTLRWLGQPDVIVSFFVMLPDPNLNGLDAPSNDPATDPAAEALYMAAMEQYTSIHRMRYVQAMSSHIGSVSYGEHVVNDGTDGSTPGFTFDIPGGWQYIVIGTTSWSKRPNEPWEVGEVNPMIPPDRWDEEYAGARGFQFGRIEEVAGEASQVITFVVPGTKRQITAWYVWWIGTESGQLHREMMISQSHYMLSEFSDIDEPLSINPPASWTDPSLRRPHEAYLVPLA